MAAATAQPLRWSCRSNNPGNSMRNAMEIANRRILVIDDNPAIHEDFRKIFSSSQQQGSALADSEAALFGQSPVATSVPPFEFQSPFHGPQGLSLLHLPLHDNRPYP